MGVRRGLYLPVPQNFRPPAPPPSFTTTEWSVLRDDARTTAAQKTMEETD